MIRLPPSRIQLTEADVNNHLQRVVANRSILPELFLQAGIYGGGQDSYISLIPSPLTPSSLSSYTPDTLDDDEVYDKWGSFMTDGTQDYYRLGGPGAYRPRARDETLDRVESPPELLDFETTQNGYGTDIPADGRIAGRRMLEETRSFISARLSRLDSIHPGGAFSSFGIPTASRSYSRPEGARRWSRSRDPHTRLLTDAKLSARGDPLDESGFTPIHRHAVRTISLLRFKRNVDSEQSQETDTVDQGGDDRAQDRDSLTHQYGETRSSHYRRGYDAGADGHSPNHLPNSYTQETDPSSSFYHERDSNLTATGKTSSEREESDIGGKLSESSIIDSGTLDYFNAFAPMQLYREFAYERTRLPGDEVEDDSPSTLSDVSAGVTGGASQGEVPEGLDSGHEMDESMESANAALTLQAMSRSQNGEPLSRSCSANNLDQRRMDEAALFEDYDSEEETLDDGENSDSSPEIQPLDVAQSSPIANIGPITASDQRPGCLSRPGDARGRPVTPVTPRRVRFARSPTSLRSDSGHRAQRDVQVYDDRRPATRPRTQNTGAQAPWTVPSGGHASQAPQRRRPNRSAPVASDTPVRRSARNQRRGGGTLPDSNGLSFVHLGSDNQQGGANETESPVASGSTQPGEPAAHHRLN